MLLFMMSHDCVPGMDCNLMTGTLNSIYVSFLRSRNLIYIFIFIHYDCTAAEADSPAISFKADSTSTHNELFTREKNTYCETTRMTSMISLSSNNLLYCCQISLVIVRFVAKSSVNSINAASLSEKQLGAGVMNGTRWIDSHSVVVIPNSEPMTT